MTKNHDALREALDVMRDKPESQEAGFAYIMLSDHFAASKPEPQAQAGEPEVVALRWPYKFRDIGETGAYEYHSRDFAVLAHLPLGEELITLQSHREAMAKLQAEVEKWSDRAANRTGDWHEAIAKKDAALLACVEALQRCEAFLDNAPTEKLAIAAITQAEEALK